MIHAVLRDDRPYIDPGIDYERLVVERNAPRWIRTLNSTAFSRRHKPCGADPTSLDPAALCGP